MVAAARLTRVSVGSTIRPVKVALLQFEPWFGEVDENLDSVRSRLAGLRADLVVLPELCTTGYQFRDRGEAEKLAQPADGPAMGALARIAADCGGMLVAGFAESAGGRIFNSAALVGSRGTLGVYRKIHLFDDECRIFDPGDLGFPVFDIGPARIGMMICFDWIFPEAARSLAVGGAQLIAHPANLVLPFCQKAMVTRAIENRVFTATCNRIGREERIAGRPLTFTGSSRLVAPGGRVLAECSPDGQELVSYEIDPALADDKHVTARNDLLRDRRPDQYRLDDRQ